MAVIAKSYVALCASPITKAFHTVTHLSLRAAQRGGHHYSFQ